jgi:hypothetical protein
LFVLTPFLKGIPATSVQEAPKESIRLGRGVEQPETTAGAVHDPGGLGVVVGGGGVVPKVVTVATFE